MHPRNPGIPESPNLRNRRVPRNSWNDMAPVHFGARSGVHRARSTGRGARNMRTQFQWRAPYVSTTCARVGTWRLMVDRCAVRLARAKECAMASSLHAAQRPIVPRGTIPVRVRCANDISPSSTAAAAGPARPRRRFRSGRRGTDLAARGTAPMLQAGAAGRAHRRRHRRSDRRRRGDCR